MGAFEDANYLVNMLTEHHGNISQSARASGKDRRTFQRLLRKHGSSGSHSRDRFSLGHLHSGMLPKGPTGRRFQLGHACG